MKKVVSLLLLLSTVFLVGCTNDNKKEESKDLIISSSESEKTKNTSEHSKMSLVDVFNTLADSSKTVSDIYYTSPVEVGVEKDVVPGIYDLEVTGGSGNINVERKEYYMPYVNWIGESDSENRTHPSKFRILLVDGDKIELNGISKFNLISVEKKIKSSKELKNGEFIVGRDIPSGKYKVKTNINLDTEIGPSWDIMVTDLETGKTNNQRFNKENNDIAFDLSEGQVLTTVFFNYDRSITPDDALIIFEEI